MDAPGIETLAGIGGTILLGATLSALDAGLESIGDVRLRALAEEGHRGAARVLADARRLRATWLAGRVLCLAASAALAVWWALPRGGLFAVVGPLLVAFAYAALTQLLRTVASQRARGITLRAIAVLRPLEWVLAPLAAPVLLVARLTERAVPAPTEQDAPRLTELAVEQMIDEGEEMGSIATDHAEMLRSVLEFRNTVAHEVMVPRTNTVAIALDTPLDDVIELIVESGHSRYPVYRNRIDDVVGILYAKDLFSFLKDRQSGDDLGLAQLIRKPVKYAAENQKIGSLLREMQSRHVHLAVVVDEFGGTSGIVTLEDILEEIVGEIRDEHDLDEVRVEEIGPGRYLADAGISVYDLEDILGEPVADGEGSYDSLGGLVIELAGRVPVEGESIRVGGYDLLVRQADERRVIQVELRLRALTEPPPVGEQEAAAQ